MTRVTGHWLKNPAAQNLCSAFDRAGYECYFVGGCVRNSLLGKPVNDIDIATNAHPNIVIDIANTNALRSIPTGIDHGTVTVVSDGIPFEITTYRKDVKTDGRHAKISFSDSIKEDAMRRDFTMNAIYCDRNGSVIDPLNGIKDLNARRVRFIMDPDRRIKEDYLRILRFFRFHAWYGSPENGIDADGLSACAQNLDGLKQLSKERIGAEVLKLLSAANPAPSVAAMEVSGVLNQILPGATAKSLPILIDLEEKIDAHPNPFRRLAGLGLNDLQKTLRLSNSQTKELVTLQKGINSSRSPIVQGYLYGVSAAIDIALLRSAMTETPFPTNVQNEIQAGAQKQFPIQPSDLMPELTGATLGNALKFLKQEWFNSNLTADKSSLMALLPQAKNNNGD